MCPIPFRALRLPGEGMRVPPEAVAPSLSWPCPPPGSLGAPGPWKCVAGWPAGWVALLCLAKLYTLGRGTEPSWASAASSRK